MRAFGRALEDTVPVYVASATSMVIACVFIFVWAPHPWGWEGFDHYHDLGRLLARGEPFPTTDVPWGYAYFLAPFYRLFGDRPWIPLLAQAALNATAPFLVYEFVRTEFDARIAVIAAVLTGVFSFNTVYASTQSSDAVCNVIFLATVVAFVRGRRRDETRWMAVSGALAGLASQFRPNLLFVPLLLAGFHVLTRPHSRRRVSQAAILIAASALALMPWIVRNYRLTGEIIPTSTHGGVQLWYGSLQTGPYLTSFSYNPRTVFEHGTFPYTSLDRVPLIFSARLDGCTSGIPRAVTLIYWTDRNPAPVRVPMRSDRREELVAEVQPDPAPTAYYYYFDVAWADAPAARLSSAARDAQATPLVFFVSRDHLGDQDRHGDLLDIFDVVRMLRHIAWGEPLPLADRLDFDGDGRVTVADLRIAVATLLSSRLALYGADNVAVYVEPSPGTATLRLPDASRISVPRQWTTRITELDLVGPVAERLLHSTVPLAALRDAARPDGEDSACRRLDAIDVNAPFYRREPHAMRRYLALAFDNIRRDPKAYAASAVYRALRVFIVHGSDDVRTAQQFAGAHRVYAAATVISLAVVVPPGGGWRGAAAMRLTCRCC
jgi:hypothetical protein